MIIQSFVLLLPLYVLIIGGYTMGRFVDLSEDTLIRVISDFLMPLLVFSSLYLSPISLNEMLGLTASVFSLMIMMLLAGFLYSSIFARKQNEFILPVIFMNSGFLGIPLMQLWGGNEAMNIIIIIDQILGFFMFTLGYLILEGGITTKGFKASVKSPILWALVAGFVFNYYKIPLPGSLIESFTFAGNAAPPLAAFAVGLSLSGRQKEKISIHVYMGIILRIVGGFLAGLAVVHLFSLTGTMRTIILVNSALPAAVYSYVLPARLGHNSSIPREIVIISTLLGVFTIPLSFYLVSIL